MESKGKAQSLFITQAGKKYIENIKDFTICKPELTAEWETRMQHIKEGSESYENVEKEMLQYIKEMIKEIESADIKKSSWSGNKTTGLICPICGNPVLNSKFGYFCSEKKNGCTFSIQNTIAEKKLTEKNLKDLCEKGKTGMIKGFKSKAGKPFDAALKLTILDGDTKTSKVEFVFENSEPKETKSSYQCPHCQSAIIADIPLVNSNLNAI